MARKRLMVIMVKVLNYRNKIIEKNEINVCMGLRLVLVMKETHFRDRAHDP